MRRNGGIPALSGIQGVVFHSFQGKLAWWGASNTSLLDVAKVCEIYHKKRLFKIFDRECDYKVVVSYRDPRDGYIWGVEGLSLIPVISYGCRATHTVSRRFATEEAAMAEIAEIAEKKEKLDRYTAGILSKILYPYLYNSCVKDE